MCGTTRLGSGRAGGRLPVPESQPRYSTPCWGDCRSGAVCRPIWPWRRETTIVQASSPPIFDGHNDTVLSLMKTGRSFLERSSEGHIDLPRAREGNLGGGFFAVYIRDPVTVTQGKDSQGKSRAADLEAAMSIYADESTWPEPM